MMLVSSDGAVVSGAALDYLPNRYYWVTDAGKTQMARVVIDGGKFKWKPFDGPSKAFVEAVIKGPIEEP